MANLDLSRLKELSPETRARVEDALKATLESQLANAAAGGLSGGAGAQAHSRSKSFFFSRSKTTDSIRDRPYELDNSIVRNLNTMDDASFSKFADRLSTLRKIGEKAG